MREIQFPFSDAAAVAHVVSHPEYSTHVLIGHPSIKASALGPYLAPNTLWYPDIAAFGSYITWNSRYESGSARPLPDALDAAEAAFPTENLLLILDVPLPESQARGYSLIYKSPETVFGHGDEMYYLYASSR